MDFFSVLKNYVGVHFKGSWEVVPKIWLNMKNGRPFCLYPNTGNVQSMAKSLHPPEGDWKQHLVLRIGETSSEYLVVNIFGLCILIKPSDELHMNELK